MAVIVSCKPTAKGTHSFYLETGGKIHFLFSQDYRRGVNEYFRKGVRIDNAINFSRAKGNTALLHTTVVCKGNV